MGHRNTQFTGHMIDMQTYQQSPLHPEPCIIYNFPQPHNIHRVFPTTTDRCDFNFRHMPGRRGSTLFYGMPHSNGVQTHNTTPNLDFAIATPSHHYNPYMVGAPPPSAIRDFSTQANYGIVGIPTVDNMLYVDGIGGSFKTKNAEGVHDPSAGPSSSVAPSFESDITLTDTASLYGGSSDPTSVVESGSQVSTGISHLVQGTFVAQPVGLPGTPWLDVRFGADDRDFGSLGWMHAPIPYVHASNRSSSGLLPPPFAQAHPNPHHPPPPMQGVRGYNVNLSSQVAPSSRRISTISSNTATNPFQDVRPTFLAPVTPMGFRLYRPLQREIIVDPSARHHTVPHLRVLPEDEVAILEMPRYHEAGESIDQHRDMRLDIDHMSYEELLALEAQIGSVGTGLSQEFIKNNLKVRTFTRSASRPNLEEETCLRHQIDFCVVCQTEYEDGEDIGTVDCGHEYHRECINKWLLLKNTCPVCKSTALSRKP
ncbi:hypothetical protein OROMI_017388 [Orobanche minor]